MRVSPAREAAGRKSRPLTTVIAIFGGVGVAATLCYFLVANLLSGLAGLPAVAASVCAYLGSAAFSYYGHKHWSFASTRAHAIAVPRFLVSTAIGLLLACLLPVAAAQMSLPATAAYAATCLIVPILNFFLLGRWVFDAAVGERAAIGNEASLLRPRFVVGVVVGVVVAVCALSVWAAEAPSRFGLIDRGR